MKYDFFRDIHFYYYKFLCLLQICILIKLRCSNATTAAQNAFRPYAQRLAKVQVFNIRAVMYIYI